MGSGDRGVIQNLTKCFKNTVMEARNWAGLTQDIPIGPHQVRKLAASYSKKLGMPEKIFRKKMGFSSVAIMRKNYMGEVPDLKFSCVLPGGIYNYKGNRDFSDSD